MMTVTIDTSELRRSLEARAAERDRRMHEILDRVGERVVELLTSYTGERNKRGRRTHPGGWADRTFNLASAFGHEVSREGGNWTLTILNSAPHAHLVEAVDGIFVVRGVAEPGGPVQRAFRQAVQELAPGWEVAR